MSASIPLPTETEEQFQERLHQYAEDYRDRINSVTTDGLEVGDFADFEGLYQQLVAMSVRCMSTYISLRYLEDYIHENVTLAGEDEEE